MGPYDVNYFAAAKQQLVTDIANNSLYSANRLEEFFRKHVVEFGRSITVSRQEILHLGEAFNEYHEHREKAVIRDIANHIFNQGAYSKEVFKGEYQTVTNLRVLAMVFPGVK